MQSIFDYPIRILIIVMATFAIIGLAVFNISTGQMSEYTDYVQAHVVNDGGLTGRTLVDAQSKARTTFDRNGRYQIINPKTRQPFKSYVTTSGDPVSNAETLADAEIKSAGYGPVRYGTAVNVYIKSQYSPTFLKAVGINSDKIFIRKVSAVTNAFVPGLDQ